MAAVSSRYAAPWPTSLPTQTGRPEGRRTAPFAGCGISAKAATWREVWESPAILAEQKHHVLDALAARIGVTDRPVRNFIARAHRSGSHRAAA